MISSPPSVSSRGERQHHAAQHQPLHPRRRLGLGHPHPLGHGGQGDLDGAVQHAGVEALHLGQRHRRRLAGEHRRRDLLQVPEEGIGEGVLRGADGLGHRRRQVGQRQRRRQQRPALQRAAAILDVQRGGGGVQRAAAHRRLLDPQRHQPAREPHRPGGVAQPHQVVHRRALPPDAVQHGGVQLQHDIHVGLADTRRAGHQLGRAGGARQAHLRIGLLAQPVHLRLGGAQPGRHLGQPGLVHQRQGLGGGALRRLPELRHAAEDVGIRRPLPAQPGEGRAALDADVQHRLEQVRADRHHARDVAGGTGIPPGIADAEAGQQQQQQAHAAQDGAQRGADGPAAQDHHSSPCGYARPSGWGMRLKDC
ncbi:hypothetical protein [Teichococcus cervicalis]|uniref:hypothetical protein n=1 Tax=Teichococcus cervicalis TaxID=204525 RepID=UPI0036D3FB62